MTKRIFLPIVAIVFCCGFTMKANPTSTPAVHTPTLQAPAFTWNFIYAFGNGAVPGLSWSSNYLYISSGNYIVYSANGYGYLTPSSPVYCNAVDNANTYVQVYQSGSSAVSYYDFQNY